MTPEEMHAYRLALFDKGLTGEALMIWVVYDSPLDAPGLWIVRPQVPNFMDPDHPIIAGYAFTFSTLARAHAFCERMGLAWLSRHPEDEPHIVGCWL